MKNKNQINQHQNQSSSPKIILASGSPRRREILSKLGIDFEIQPADIDETWNPNETPYEYVHRMSIEKAEKIAKENKEAIVIGGDVTVEIENQAIGKSQDKKEAFRVLKKLSGREHYIRDGYACFYKGELYFSGVITAEVVFKQISDHQIQDYLETTDEWIDKAASYAIQGEAGKFVDNVVGSYFDVVGLPIFHVMNCLSILGIKIDPGKYQELFDEDREFLAEVISKQN